MKKYFALLFFFLIPMLYGEHDLSFKFAEGQSKAYEASIDLKMTQSLPETCDMQYRFYAKFLLTHTVKKVLENGDAEIEASLRNPDLIVSMACPMPGSPFNFEYDSTAKGVVNGDALPFQELKEAIRDTTYILTVSPKGTILNVSGLRPLQEKVEKKAFSATPIVAQGLMAIVSEQSAQFIHEPIFGHVPPKPVAVGGTWNQEEHPPIVRKFTLAGADETKLTVQEEITLNLDSSEENPMMTLDLKGAITGTLTLDPATGWPIENTSKGTFSGKQVLNTPLLEKPLELPLKIEVATDYKNVSHG